MVHDPKKGVFQVKRKTRRIIEGRKRKTLKRVEKEGIMRKLTWMISFGLMLVAAGCATGQGAIADSNKTSQCTQAHVQGPGILTTESGLAFEVPSGFSATAKCELVTLESDEFDLWALQLDDMDLKQAIDEAWARVVNGFTGKVETSLEPPAEQPWEAVLIRNYVVDDKKVFSQAVARRREGKVYVHLVRGTIPVLDKRGAQLRAFIGSMKVPGSKEIDLTDVVAQSVAGRTDQIDELIAECIERTGTPGLSMAIVEDGEIVYAKGYGVRKQSEPANVDPDTLMMIGSVTKSMTTLMMASLVDDGKLSWNSKVTDVYPGFSLGDEELSKKLEIQHLMCACAGLPRKDIPLVLENEGKSAKDVFRELARMKPSTGFQETFQYQNHMVAAGGYVAALSVAPDEDAHATYCELMRDRVFGPIGMDRTTLDLDRAAKDDNHAWPHAQALDGAHQSISLDHERFATYIGPSGGVWSTASEMARYLITEMNVGLSPDGKKVVTRKNLEKRWEPQVTVSKDVFYGLGWMQAKKKGLRLITHGGGTMGFATRVAFYPDKKRGVVMISNGTGGHLVEGIVQSRLDEIWFGIDEKIRQRLTFALEADKKERAKILGRASVPKTDFMKPLIGKHIHPELGVISIEERGGSYFLDAGTHRSAVLRYARSDGRTSLICADPPLAGVELILPPAGEKDISFILERGQERYDLVKQAPNGS
jgi:CubicO group peptidase (beta-lactamase class C family)